MMVANSLVNYRTSSTDVAKKLKEVGVLKSIRRVSLDAMCKIKKKKLELL